MGRRFRVDTRKYYLTHTVSQMWDLLPEDIVMPPGIRRALRGCWPQWLRGTATFRGTNPLRP